MAIAINSTFTASVPAAYGGSAPVIDLGLSPAAISTAVALANAGSVVLSLSGAPRGSVTYTAAGLLHEIGLAGATTSVATMRGDEPRSLRQDVSASLDDGGQLTDGIYDSSGAWTSTSGTPAGMTASPESDPGVSGAAIGDTVGTRLSTSA